MNGFEKQSVDWLKAGFRQDFAYNFQWLGVPIVQLPTDLVRLQQIIWETAPTLIIETGTHCGGSAVFFASMLRIIHGSGRVFTIGKKPKWKKGDAFDRHHLRSMIHTVDGSSTGEAHLEIKAYVEHNPQHKVMVFLDSFHGRDHVTRELELYSPFVSKGCYLVVCDGITELLKEHTANPAAAARDFVERNPNFVEKKLETDKHPFVTHFQNGYLKRIK